MFFRLNVPPRSVKKTQNLHQLFFRGLGLRFLGASDGGGETVVAESGSMREQAHALDKIRTQSINHKI